MQKKKFVTIFLSVILFIAIAVLGVANVYRVDSVSLRPSTVSTQAEEEATRLQERLSEVYVGGNTLFVDKSAAEAVLQEFPYFRITAFKKEFPNHLVVEVKEDEEMFAVKIEDKDEYFILGLDGVLLSKRVNPENRTGKYPNIIVSGLKINSETGKVVSGSKEIDGFVQVVSAIASTEGLSENLRSNVTEISVSAPLSTMTCITLHFKEGVKARIFEFEKDATSKARQVAEKYLSLADYQKVTGEIVAVERESDVYVEYYPNGFPQGVGNS